MGEGVEIEIMKEKKRIITGKEVGNNDNVDIHTFYIRRVHMFECQDYIPPPVFRKEEEGGRTPGCI